MIKHKDLKDKEVDNVPQKCVRKPYVKPQITEYGHMEKLTESGGTKSPDVGRKFPY